MHLEPIPGLTLSFAAAIILLDLATQKILGKVGEGKKSNDRKKPHSSSKLFPF